MEKINIAELLKDCPKGMELYSPLCGKCVFDRLNMGTIICKKQNTQEITFTSEGYYMIPVFDNCECMIFPSKDQRDWSKFQRPFKNGDIVITTLGNTAIIKESAGVEYFVYCIWIDAHLHTVPAMVCVERLATEEEKQELFDAIKDKGYKWNDENKTLDKLIEPKFKVGDKIKSKENRNYIYTITGIREKENKYECGVTFVLRFSEQDNWELVPNKFDITTLKPFDKVLARDYDNAWATGFYSHFETTELSSYYVVNGTGVDQCIPYEGNEHLLGTKNDCDEFYKTWE